LYVREKIDCLTVQKEAMGGKTLMLGVGGTLLYQPAKSGSETAIGFA